MKNKEECARQIQRLKEMGVKPNCSELARIYDLDRRTVKRLLEAGGIPPRKKREEFSRWDPWEDQIRERMAVPGTTIRGLHESFRVQLGDENLPGTYESLKAFLRKKNIHKATKKSLKNLTSKDEPKQ